MAPPHPEDENTAPTADAATGHNPVSSSDLPAPLTEPTSVEAAATSSSEVIVPKTTAPLPAGMPIVATDVTPLPVVEKRSASVHDILRDPVTSHMRAVSPLLHRDQTVGEALETIRTSQDVGRVIYFYVVDDQRQLLGVVATRKLLLSTSVTKIAEIMSTRTITVPATATVLEACEYFTRDKLLAFPVVDDERRIVGAVDIDLYTEEIQEIDRRQDSDDLFQLIGVHLTEASQGNSRAAFLGRFPWLLCNVGGGMLSALIADAYQDVSTLAVVAPFIALVTALAESVSIQSVSLALQMLHTQPPEWKVFLRKVQREVFVGFLLGGGCGLTVAVVAFLWKGSLTVALSLLLGIVGGVAASAGVGLSIPFILKLFRRDPQLAAGPIALAMADVVTLLCYFNLGRWLLGSYS